VSREVEERPIWFGDDGAQLFGWLHIPSSLTARAGLLLCPPLARELSATSPAYRRVASTTSARGFLVLRFAYHGTGDSAGIWPEESCVDLWTGDLRRAAGLLRSMGCMSLVAVGALSGSLVLAEAIRQQQGLFDSTVLWDPYPNGRAFLRAEQLAARVADIVVDTSGDHVELPGYRLSPRVATEIGALTLTPLPEPLAVRLAVIERKDRPALGNTLTARGRRTETVTVGGGIEPGEVLNLRAGVPLPGETDLVAWLESATSAERVLVTLPVVSPSTVIVQPSGAQLREEAVVLGPAQLFGIATSTAGLAPRERAAVVLLSVADENHIGTFRQWVTLARSLAERGFTVLRCDLSGIGDSPTRPGGVPHAINADHAVDDVTEIVAAFRPDLPTVLVGLCSGADVAVDAALSGTSVDDLVLINPGYRRVRGASPEAASPRTATARGLQPLRLLRAARERHPGATFRLLDLLGIDRSPVRHLMALRDSRTRIHLLLGDADTRWNEQHGGWLLRYLVRSKSLEFIRVTDLDHAGAGSIGRAALLDAVTDLLEKSYPGSRSPLAPTAEIVGARAECPSVM